MLTKRPKKIHYLHGVTQKKHRFNFKRFTYVFQSLVIVLATSFPLLTQAESDTTAPTLLNYVRVSTYDRDVGQSDYKEIDVDLNVTDNLSGFDTGTLIYTSLSGRHTVSTVFEAPAPGETYVRAQVQLPQYSENGIWTPTLILRDRSGNTRNLDTTQLQSMGFADINVSLYGGEDLEPPRILNLHNYPQSPVTYDISEGIGDHYFSVALDDNLTPPYVLDITYTSPSGNQTVQVTTTQVPDDAQFDIPMSFPRYSEVGVWEPFVVLKDNVGNVATYTNDELMAINCPDARVTLTGTDDVVDPQVTSLSFGTPDESVGEPPLGSATITVNATLPDNLSGTANNSKITFRSPSGQQSAFAEFYRLGDSNDFVGTTFLPPYSEAGEWTPELYLVDHAGNTRIENHANLVTLGFDLSFTVDEIVVEEATANETITTDAENDGATPTDPIEVSLTTLNAGSVSLVTLSAESFNNGGPSDFTYVGNQISIDAPSATPEAPLVLSFRVDDSQIPANLVDINLLEIKRNGVTVEDCTSPTFAIPDPCVASRQLHPDGDVTITVRTSEASVWGVGLNKTAYSFESFLNPVKNSPMLNQVNAGSTVPVKFSLGGDQGLNILEAGYPVSQPISCGSFAETDSATIPSISNQGLKYTDGNYHYNWKTQSSWKNSCRQFILKFSNGETAVAYFKIK
jgi:hypothetical protein